MENSGRKTDLDISNLLRDRTLLIKSRKSSSLGLLGDYRVPENLYLNNVTGVEMIHGARCAGEDDVPRMKSDVLANAANRLVAAMDRFINEVKPYMSV